MSTKAHIEKYRQAVDPGVSKHPGADRERLILRYAPLVKYIAGRMAMRLPGSVSIDELISAGTFGLIDAVDKFEPEKGNRFETYARHRIKGAMLDELRRSDWVSRSVRREIAGIEKAVHELYATLMREPEDHEIAAKLGVSLDAYYKMLDRTGSVGLAPLSDAALEGGYTSKTPHQWTPPSPVDEMERKEMKQLVAAALTGLKKKEQLVISLYYYEELTLKEIAKILELTESRICQIHTQSIVKLRSRMKSNSSAV